MCAIFGIFPQASARGVHGGSKRGSISVPPPEPLADMLKHRGPDSTRWVSACSGWLGACRNAIVGDATGDQPFIDESGTVAFVGNGEIYNCGAIARELKLGRELRSDIDIVGEVYGRYGSHGLAKLNGEWALAIIDMTRRRLVLSRDSFGTHPLFYFVNQGLVGFASEIKAFTRCAGFTLGLNTTAPLGHGLLRRHEGNSSILIALAMSAARVLFR